MNATRVVALFTRKCIEALRSVESRPRSRRRPNRENFRRNGRRKLETAGFPDKQAFLIFREQRSQTGSKKLERDPLSSLNSEDRSFSWKEKKKKKKLDQKSRKTRRFQSLRERSFDLTGRGKSVRAKEKKKKRKGDRKTIGRGKGEVLRVDKLMHPSPPFRIGFL